MAEAATVAAAVASRLAPEPKLQRIGKQASLVSREDRATLRRMAAELQGPGRWKEICASEIGVRLGLTTKQLRNVTRVKPLEPPSTAQWSDELQRLLLAEVASRGRSWVAIRDEGAGGAFRAFRSEDLRRHYDTPPAEPRHGYMVGARRVRGVTLVKDGRYQVTFQQRYVGLRDTLAEAAALWDAQARAAGLPDSELNGVVPEPDAAGAPRDAPVKRECAQYTRSADGATVSLRAGHAMPAEAFLAAAAAMCKEESRQSSVTWGALARRLGCGDLVGKSAAVHACWAELMGVDMKTTLWEAYRGNGRQRAPNTAAPAAEDAAAAAAAAAPECAATPELSPAAAAPAAA